MDLSVKSTLKIVAHHLGVLPYIQLFKREIREVKSAYSLASRTQNRQFIQENSHFVSPPATLAYDAYGDVDWKKYNRQGHQDACLISKLIQKHHSSVKTVLDWGCGPARVLRHLSSFSENSTIQFYGSDYNPQTIKWCKKHFAHSQFHQNQLNPPLPFPSHFFDVVYGISVFTHLSEKSHYEWIHELERILKSEGILILTTHGDHFKNVLTPEEEEKYHEHQLVTRENAREGKRDFASFHPPRFLKEKLFKNFHILEHIPGSTHTIDLKQDVWVLKKQDEQNTK